MDVKALYPNVKIDTTKKSIISAFKLSNQKFLVDRVFLCKVVSVLYNGDVFSYSILLKPNEISQIDRKLFLFIKNNVYIWTRKQVDTLPYNLIRPVVFTSLNRYAKINFAHKCPLLIHHNQLCRKNHFEMPIMPNMNWEKIKCTFMVSNWYV